MSATDSESSIDWLATDNEEDEENERDNEPDCGTRRPGSSVSPGSSPSRRGPPPESDSSSSSSSSSSGSGGGVLHHHSSRRSEAAKRACSDVWSAVGDSDARRPCQTQAGGDARGVRNPLKRPHVSAEALQQPLSNQGDSERVFTSKCMALQCYIHPLSSILNGLRSGRYRERLSSFQESVAIDRIQRIMGVLQNPCMGEKYVNIILKMEEMLKSWFPNIKPQDQRTVAQTEHEASTKKLKLSSPVTTDLTGPPPSLAGPDAPTAQGPEAQRVQDHGPAGAYPASSSSSLKWLHTSPICSPGAGPPPPAPPQQQQQQQQPQLQASSPRHPPPAPRDKELMQDSAVSSSTDRRARTDAAAAAAAAAAPLKAPPLGKKINAPCLERLLKSTESIVSRRASGRGLVGNS